MLADIGLNVPLVRQRLYEWVRGYRDNDSAWRVALTGGAVLPWRRAEFAADSTTGPDLLDIEQDVLALATLVAARDSAPPLSIGLFGDWGSGKTFFMGQLRKTVAKLSVDARNAKVMQRDYPFYKRIVQIEFNAWHYAEGNLWASMVEHILANLRVSEEPDATATEVLQKHLIDRLGFTEQAVIESQQKRGQAAARVTNAEEAVRLAAKAHDDKKQKLQELSRDSVGRDFALSGAHSVIAQALGPLGFDPASAAVQDLQASLREARAVFERGNAPLTALVHAPDRPDRWRSLLIILLGAPLAAGVLGVVLAPLLGQAAQVSAFVTGAAGLLTGVAGWIRKQAEWVAAQQKIVAGAEREYDKALAAKLADMAEERARTEQELALARQDYLLAQQRAEEARRQRDVAGAELAAATTSRLLGQFIQDRAASTDYRKHLGVLAVVRQDFQQLSRLIEEENWRLAPDDPAQDERYAGRLKKVASLEEEERKDDAARRINRIVLYIDDLDRCPPAKVVEVLQAVHLLLAFPLFVVVVGVDARWISRSLESRYRELLGVGDRAGAVDIVEMFGVARSEDYLEKIFQIPLWLRRMDANAARRMVQGMLGKGASRAGEQKAPSNPAEVQSNARPAATAGTPANPNDQQAVDNAMPSANADAGYTVTASRRSTESSVKTGNSHDTQTPNTVPRHHAVPNLESLNVRDFELTVIDSLSPLLGRSPRALKRFVNLYRVIKAGLTPTEHDVFVQRSKRGLDHYAAVLFLLAVDTGLPRAAVAMFDVLLAVNRGQGIAEMKEFMEQLEEHPAAKSLDFAVLNAWIAAHRETRWFDSNAIGRLAAWAPRVVRHSFQAADVGKSFAN